MDDSITFEEMRLSKEPGHTIWLRVLATMDTIRYYHEYKYNLYSDKELAEQLDVPLDFVKAF